MMSGNEFEIEINLDSPSPTTKPLAIQTKNLVARPLIPNSPQSLNTVKIDDTPSSSTTETTKLLGQESYKKVIQPKTQAKALTRNNNVTDFFSLKTARNALFSLCKLPNNKPKAQTNTSAAEPSSLTMV